MPQFQFLKDAGMRQDRLSTATSTMSGPWPLDPAVMGAAGGEMMLPTFDPELHFWPNLDGEEGRKKQEKAEVFWHAFWELLFPETTKYLDGNAFSQYLPANLGSSNVCIKRMLTNDFFNVSRKPHDDGVASASNSPLLCGTLDRKLRAVDSVNKKNFQNNWRVSCIPTKLEVEKEVKEPAIAPRIIQNDDLARTRFKGDDVLWMPRRSLTVSFLTAIMHGIGEMPWQRKVDSYLERTQNSKLTIIWPLDTSPLHFHLTVKIRVPPRLANIFYLGAASAFIGVAAADSPNLGTQLRLKVITGGSAIVSWGAGLTSIQISQMQDVPMAAKISTRVGCSVFLLIFIFSYTYFFNREPTVRRQFLAGIGGLTSILWSFVRRESATASETMWSFLWLDHLNLFILLAATVYILAADTPIMDLIMTAHTHVGDEEQGGVGDNAGGREV